MKTFDDYVRKVVRKHRSQTRAFNLQHGRWGNVEPMLARIRQEMLEEARHHKTREKEKYLTIDAALNQIRIFYSK